VNDLPEAPAESRPRLRGVSHLWAAIAAAVGGAALIAGAPTSEAAVAVTIYAAGLTAQFAVSAVYHRVRWSSPRARARMRHLDHAAIFLCIAATYTPFALLVLDGWSGTALLIAVWVGATLGVARQVAWPAAPRWVTVASYLVLGWLAVLITPEMARALGWTLLALLVSGVLYSAGAVIYARRRPDPWPSIFGYHEIFHALVIAAAAVQFAVIAAAVLPRAG
jgi:hemolysin III